MDNNAGKLIEFGLFLAENGVGVGWGSHYEDRRWQNEVKLYVRQGVFANRPLLDGLKDFLIPKGSSAWKKKEIAHETFYGWGFVGVYVDVPSIKTTSRWLSQ